MYVIHIHVYTGLEGFLNKSSHLHIELLNNLNCIGIAVRTKLQIYDQKEKLSFPQ